MFPSTSHHLTVCHSTNRFSTELSSSPFIVLPLSPVFDVTRAHPTLNNVLPFYYAGVDVEPFTNKKLTQPGDLLLITTGVFISKYAIAKAITSHDVYALISDSTDPSKHWQTSLNFTQFQRVLSQGDDVEIEAGPHLGKRGFILEIVNQDALVVCGNFSAEVKTPLHQRLH